MKVAVDKGSERLPGNMFSPPLHAAIHFCIEPSINQGVDMKFKAILLGFLAASAFGIGMKANAYGWGKYECCEFKYEECLLQGRPQAQCEAAFVNCLNGGRCVLD
jgi:hypothetical protein